MAERRAIDNLISPKPIPSFTEATSVSGKWVDGTASGSATDLGYSWYTITGAGSMSYSITEEGVTLSALNATGRGRLSSGSFETSPTISQIKQYGIPLKASTSYTFSFKAKGINVLANAIRANILMFTTSGAFVTNSTVVISTGDSDWTSYSGAFTTGATVAYGTLRLIVETAGNIMSATFKELKLDTTTPTTRTSATRTAITQPRVAVRDMGTALRFDGASKVGMGDKFNIGTGSMSFSGVFKPLSITANQTLLSKRNSSLGTESGYSLSVTSAGFLRTYFGDGTAGSDTTVSTFKLIVGRWYTYEYIIDRTLNKKRLYVNNVLISDVDISAVSANQTNTVNFYFGATNTTGTANLFIGLIDEPRIWNRALTAQEVSDLYFNNIVPDQGNPDVLKLELLFNEASGLTAIDSSGNGNDGTHNCTYTLDVPLKERDVV